MNPYFEDKGIVIYHGDCREILSSLPKVDLVLTDPPYGIDVGFGWASSQMGYCDAPDRFTLRAVVEAGQSQIIWGMNYLVLPPTRSFLCWYKRPAFKSQSECELAWTSLNVGARCFDYLYSGNCEGGLWRTVDYQKVALHPCEKPVAVLKWCFGFAPNAQSILDPFMGSGTTLRAAKDLGRKAIGIEIEEKYCEIAAKRLSQEVLNFENVA